MKILVLLISIFFIIPHQTERYYIVKVKGVIFNVETGNMLAQGDEIGADDELRFEDANAMAMVVSDAQKKYSLKFANANEVDDELLSSVKNSLKLVKTKRIKTRGLITNAAIKDLKEFLGDNEFTVIGNSVDVNLSKSTFQNQSVEIKYDVNGRPISRELIKGDTLLNLSRKELGAKSYGEVKLYHVEFFKHDKTQESVEKITKLDLNFVDENTLRDEFKTIIGVYKKRNYSKTDMKSFLMEYFVDFYGNTHEYTLSNYVDKIIADNMQ